jgi:hypothetical protein
MSLVEVLPAECIINIFRLLNDPLEVERLKRTCKYFRMYAIAYLNTLSILPTNSPNFYDHPREMIRRCVDAQITEAYLEQYCKKIKFI